MYRLYNPPLPALLFWSSKGENFRVNEAYEIYNWYFGTQHNFDTAQTSITQSSDSIGSYLCQTGWAIWEYFVLDNDIQLDWASAPEPTKINLPANQKGYDTFETTVGKLSARRIKTSRVYFCLGIILKVILNNFQNNA